MWTLRNRRLSNLSQVSLPRKWQSWPFSLRTDCEAQAHKGWGLSASLGLESLHTQSAAGFRLPLHSPPKPAIIPISSLPFLWERYTPFKSFRLTFKYSWFSICKDTMHPIKNSNGNGFFYKERKKITRHLSTQSLYAPPTWTGPFFVLHGAVCVHAVFRGGMMDRNPSLQ